MSSELQIWQGEYFAVVRPDGDLANGQPGAPRLHKRYSDALRFQRELKAVGIGKGTRIARIECTFAERPLRTVGK